MTLANRLSEPVHEPMVLRSRSSSEAEAQAAQKNQLRKAEVIVENEVCTSAKISSVRLRSRLMAGDLKIELEMVSSKILSACERNLARDTGERNAVLRRSQGEPEPPRLPKGLPPKLDRFLRSQTWRSSSHERSSPFRARDALPPGTPLTGLLSCPNPSKTVNSSSSSSSAFAPAVGAAAAGAGAFSPKTADVSERIPQSIPSDAGFASCPN
mmetsp:Transcript_64240/g.143558  ORF Transcript_64240/g.143558 Transcript_64240/m.143558 type:complete len:212 (+) Transcript_64240:226-861(+)